jgi:hypothetical protein
VLEVNEEDANCAICLEPYQDGSHLKQLPCKHHFDAECIVHWLRKNAKCPLCIQQIIRNENSEIHCPYLSKHVSFGWEGLFDVAT